MAGYDVFLSHNSADKAAVEALAHRLVEAGLQPFLDKWHLVPGEPWQESLEEALAACQTVAVFLGPGGISPWENEEMRSALEERVRDQSRRVIPVLLPGAPDPGQRPLPRFLRRLTWVDFRAGLDDEATFQRLAAGIRGVAPGAGAPAARPADLASERDSLQRQLAQHRRNLNKLREQAALYGAGETPLRLLNQIEAEETAIQELENRLKTAPGEA
jgi:hypothetical protein